MAVSSLITKKARNLRSSVSELQDAFGTISGHTHDGTDSASITGTSTLDQAYDQGGAGAGRSITADTGAVAITVPDASNNAALALTQNDSTNNPAAMTIANAGTGNDITGAGSSWSIAKGGVGTFDSLSVGQVTLVEDTLPAGTSCYAGRDNTGDVTVNALTGKQVHLAVAGTDVVNVAGASVTIAQALTVSAGGANITGGLTVATGGLIVSVSGAAITGNSTVTGDLAVTGSLTFGGNWTVAATLTVDELILDTDGVAPAGTNAYAVSDNTGDLTVNALTGKTVNVAIAGTDEYTFSATVLDMNANALDNCGYVILNAATAPAGTEVYLVNDNTGDLTVNALTGKMVHIAIAGVDILNVAGGAVVLNEAAADIDTRFEGVGTTYMFAIDAALDCLVLGADGNTASATRRVRITRPAKTVNDNEDWFDFDIAPQAGLTILTATTSALVATVAILEPNITLAGTAVVTEAATLYIANAPTEGGSNDAVLIGAGSVSIRADATDLKFGASRDFGLRWSTADASNHAAVLWLGASEALHICSGADVATDWNVAAASNPTVYIHGATTPATEYVAISTDETDAHLNAVGTNWAFEIGGTAEMTLAANALNLVDSVLYGSASADGNLVLSSTTDGTKGYVGIATGEEGFRIGGTATRATVGTNALHIYVGTAPAGALNNCVSLYAEGADAASELKAMDAAGNVTVLSPHTDDGDYVVHSYSAKKRETVTIHLEKMLRAIAAGDPAMRRFIEVLPGEAKRPVWTAN